MQKLLRLSSLCLLALGTQLAVAQWSETGYQSNVVEWGHVLILTVQCPTTDLYTVVNNRTCFYKVTGSSTQDPLWRPYFANLCDNTWGYSYSEQFYCEAGSIIRVYDYGWSMTNGYNSFTRSNPSDSASRTGNGEVWTDTTVEITTPPGGGGGS